MSTAKRVALVLGAGGVTGGSFHAGTLAALHDAGWDARSADLVVGTSAGAVAGAMLRIGVSPLDLASRLTGDPLTAEGRRLLAGLGPPRDPPRPEGLRFSTAGLDDPRALVAAIRRGEPPNPFALAAAAGPEGRASNDYVRTVFDAVAPDGWPSRPLSIVAVRRRDGRRVVFGHQDSPRASLGQAVAASAAVPGLYRPVEIGGDRFIDGGVHSVHNADLVDPKSYDVVLILAPMAGPTSQPTLRADLALARAIRFQLDRETRGIGRAPTVEVMAPSDEDRAIMGPNPMDPSTRGEVVSTSRESAARRLGGRLGERLATAGLF